MKNVFFCVLLVLASPAFALGQTYKVLYSFAGVPNDAAGPNSGFVYRGEQLYGASAGGGLYGYGTVFAMENFPNKITERVIYNFCTTGNANTCTDGAYPPAGLVSDQSGNLYGTAEYGGTGMCGNATCGTVFELTRSSGTWTETVIHNFSGSDGNGPLGQLIIDSSGNLYGTTFAGGAFDAGVVFELSPSQGGAWIETDLHDFSSGEDGAGPQFAGLTLDHSGNLYGVTTSGGSGSCIFGPFTGCGTVFELSANIDGTWTENILFTFGAEGDFWPESSLVLDAAGHIYGTTVGGGTSKTEWGNIFRLSYEAGVWKQVAFSFGYWNGQEPHAPVLLFGDTLYGTTYVGGSNTWGTLFKIQGSVETVLHNFTGEPDGATPSFGGSMLVGAGNIYGATFQGGAYGAGTIFQYTP